MGREWRTLFAQRFLVQRGQLNVLGSLDTQVTIVTRHSGGTYGRWSDDGSPMLGSHNHSHHHQGAFWSVNRGTSRSTPSSHHRIVLMQLEQTTYSSIPIDGSEIYEALNAGDQVSVIFNARSHKLLWVRNWATGVTVGYRPDFSGLALAAVVLAAVAIGLVPYQLLNLNSPVLPFALGSLAAGLLSYACWSSYHSSRQSWARAITKATT